MRKVDFEATHLKFLIIVYCLLVKSILSLFRLTCLTQNKKSTHFMQWGSLVIANVELYSIVYVRINSLAVVLYLIKVHNIRQAPFHDPHAHRE